MGCRAIMRLSVCFVTTFNRKKKATHGRVAFFNLAFREDVGFALP
jgi:hypothetical protein